MRKLDRRFHFVDVLSTRAGCAACLPVKVFGIDRELNLSRFWENGYRDG